MSIFDIRPDPLRRPGVASSDPLRDNAGKRPGRGSADAPRTDRVEISEEARSLAAQQEVLDGRILTAERIAFLRQRIADGFYDADEVIDRVAQRILRSGDL